MTAQAIISRIESMGGSLALNGERIVYELPISAASLLDHIRKNRLAVVELLRTRQPLGLPGGVRLVRWGPKAAPVVLTRWSVVTDTLGFVKATLSQLEAALLGRVWLAGNWSVQELIDRLEQVGVEVTIDSGDQQCTPLPR